MSSRVRVTLSAATVLCLLSALVVALAGPAEAGTPLVVTKTDDTADGTCGADCSLREAIIAANNTVAADTINVPAGTYNLTRCEANDDTESLLRAHEGTIVMHCFSEPGLLKAGLERGWYFSFAGNVTYPRAGELREAAAEVPADRILAETDSPYLSPQPLRGRPNEPAHIVHTVAALAAARREDVDELTARIEANATAAFGLA